MRGAVLHVHDAVGQAENEVEMRLVGRRQRFRIRTRVRDVDVDAREVLIVALGGAEVGLHLLGGDLAELDDAVDAGVVQASAKVPVEERPYVILFVVVAVWVAARDEVRPVVARPAVIASVAFVPAGRVDVGRPDALGPAFPVVQAFDQTREPVDRHVAGRAARSLAERRVGGWNDERHRVGLAHDRQVEAHDVLHDVLAPLSRHFDDAVRLDRGGFVVGPSQVVVEAHDAAAEVLKQRDRGGRIGDDVARIVVLRLRRRRDDRGIEGALRGRQLPNPNRNAPVIEYVDSGAEIVDRSRVGRGVEIDAIGDLALVAHGSQVVLRRQEVAGVDRVVEQGAGEVVGARVRLIYRGHAAVDRAERHGARDGFAEVKPTRVQQMKRVQDLLADGTRCCWDHVVAGLLDELRGMEDLVDADLDRVGSILDGRDQRVARRQSRLRQLESAALKQRDR